MRLPSIKRRLKVLELSTGKVNYELVNVPCTLPRHIRAIASLNLTAHIYGVVYMPDDKCDEYSEFIA